MDLTRDPEPAQLDEPVLHEGSALPREELLALYSSVGWSLYTRDPDALERAIRQTPWVLTAWSGERLVGLIRAVTDDATILYIQDILVHPEHQRAGIGRRLMERTLARFSHVRQKVLITDDEPRQRLFYQALGFRDTQDLKRFRTHAFIRDEAYKLE